MALAKNEIRFAPTTDGGVVLGPVPLGVQGDAPKRRFNCIVQNFGQESGDENMVLKAQEADAATGSWVDVAAGSVTVNLRCQEMYEFYIKGTSLYWRIYATGKTEAMIQFLDNDIDSILVVE